MTIKALVWGENIHERTNAAVGRIYPDGMHNTIASALREDPGIEAERRRCRIRSTACRRRGSPRPTCCSGGDTGRMATSPTRWSSAWRTASGRGWG